MYKMETRIRYSECGTDNKLKIEALINYFQDCTTENSERIGVGFSYLRERKRAWILNSWQIVIRRRPEVGEAVQICTWATGFQGVFGPRDFCMQTTEGEMLASAHSLWVYIDTETGRPMWADIPTWLPATILSEITFWATVIWARLWAEPATALPMVASRWTERPIRSIRTTVQTPSMAARWVILTAFGT